MAEPARQLQEDDNQPISRPELQVIAGGGQQSSGSDSAANTEMRDLRRYSDQVGRGYTESSPKSPRRWLFQKRQAAMGGGLIGTIVAGLFFFSFFSGPLEFIHLAQLLEQFHFSAGQDTQDDRAVRILRYIRDPKSPQNTRLGILSNKYANRLEAKLNKNGIKSAYSPIFGFFDGYVIDPKTFGGGMSKEEVKVYFKDKYNVNIQEVDGRLRVDARQLGYFKQRRMIRAMLQEAGYLKIGAAVHARVMGKRAGIGWHPIRKLDNAILRKAEDRFKAWQKDRTQTISKGVTYDSLITENHENDGDPKDDKDPQHQKKKEAESLKEATDATKQEGQSSGDAAKSGDGDTSLGSFKKSVATKVTLGTVATVSLACLAQGIAHNVDNIKQAQVVLPLMRFAMNLIGVGNQVKNGEDVDAEQLGFYKKLLYDPETKMDWTQAKSIQAEMGQPQTGPDIKKEAQVATEKNFLLDFVGKIKGLGSVCKVVDSKAGFVGLTVLGIFSGGPISIIVSGVVGALAGPPLIDALSHYLAGQPIDPNVKGPHLGNYANYGSKLAAGDVMISAGGRKLTTEEEQQIDTAGNLSAQAEFQEESLANRLFNPYDHRSLISKLIDKGKPDFSQNLASLASALWDVPRSLAAMPQKLAFSPAQAAVQSVDYDYGFAQYGFSKAELNSEALKNPYQNADMVVNSILPGPKGKNYMDRTKRCFGVSVEPNLNDPQNRYSVVPDTSTVPKHKDTDKAECTDKDLDWVRVRFYILDTQTMVSLACYEGDDQACSDTGFDSSGSTESGSGGAVNPPSGNVQELAKKILANPNITYPYDPPHGGGSAKTRDVLEALARGEKAPVTCSNGGVTSTDINPGILQMLLELGGQTKIGVNALTDKCHSNGSNHYKGLAVDFECHGVPFDTAKADPIAQKYGGGRNTETCARNDHWHYDFTGGM